MAEVEMMGRVGSGRVGSGRVGSGRVGSGRVGSGRVGSGRVGSAVRSRGSTWVIQFAYNFMEKIRRKRICIYYIYVRTPHTDMCVCTYSVGHNYRTMRKV